jgi:hypothetical protein
MAASSRDAHLAKRCGRAHTVSMLLLRSGELTLFHLRSRAMSVSVSARLRSDRWMGGRSRSRGCCVAPLTAFSGREPKLGSCENPDRKWTSSRARSGLHFDDDPTNQTPRIPLRLSHKHPGTGRDFARARSGSVSDPKRVAQKPTALDASRSPAGKLGRSAAPLFDAHPAVLLVNGALVGARRSPSRAGRWLH